MARVHRGTREQGEVVVWGVGGRRREREREQGNGPLEYAFTTQKTTYDDNRTTNNKYKFKGKGSGTPTAPLTEENR